MGVSVDFNDANTAWAEKLGLTYPLLSDRSRETSKAYNTIFDDPEMANNPKRIAAYLRSKRSWFVIDKEGVIRYTKMAAPKEFEPPNDEMLELLKGL